VCGAVGWGGGHAVVIVASRARHARRTAAHSVLVICLVARALACNDDEILRELVQPLEHTGAVDYGFVDEIEQALAQIGGGGGGGAPDYAADGGYHLPAEGSSSTGEIQV
jgi:hypothetical protein